MYFYYFEYKNEQIEQLNKKQRMETRVSKSRYSLLLILITLSCVDSIRTQYFCLKILL